MKTPMKGLLIYSFSAAKGNLLVGYMCIAVAGAVMLITGMSEAYQAFLSMAVTFPPFFLMSGVASANAPRWERYQISMPVKRKDVIRNYYVGVILIMLVNIPLILAVTGLGIALHNRLIFYVVEIADMMIIPLLGFPFFNGAIFYPLTLSIGEDKGESIATICGIIGVGFVILLSWIINYHNLGRGMAVLLIIAVAVIPYIISYFISQRIYSKLDLTVGGRH